LKEKSFWNKIWIFEYTRALEICTRRFRRNFVMVREGGRGRGHNPVGQLDQLGLSGPKGRMAIGPKVEGKIVFE
jgi:hypothetical protein